MEILMRASIYAANEIIIKQRTNIKEEIIPNEKIFLEQPFTVATNNYPCLIQKCGIAN